MPPMTKAQRNLIVRAIVAGNLDPAECELFYDDKTHTLRHMPSKSVIVYQPDIYGNFVVRSQIGNDPVLRSPGMPGGFKAFADQVSPWAAQVREWVDTPDLWQLSRSGKGSIPGDQSPDSDNSPFTPDEQAAISAQLKRIAESIKKTYALTVQQSAKLDDKIEEAEKASRRMGRKDWGLLFGGAVFSLILADVITPGIAGHILMMLEHGMGYLFIGGAPPARGVISTGQD